MKRKRKVEKKNNLRKKYTQKITRKQKGGSSRKNVFQRLQGTPTVASSRKKRNKKEKRAIFSDPQDPYKHLGDGRRQKYREQLSDHEEYKRDKSPDPKYTESNEFLLGPTRGKRVRDLARTQAQAQVRALDPERFLTSRRGHRKRLEQANREKVHTTRDRSFASKPGRFASKPGKKRSRHGYMEPTESSRWRSPSTRGRGGKYGDATKSSKKRSLSTGGRGGKYGDATKSSRRRSPSTRGRGGRISSGTRKDYDLEIDPQPEEVREMGSRKPVTQYYDNLDEETPSRMLDASVIHSYGAGGDQGTHGTLHKGLGPHRLTRNKSTLAGRRRGRSNIFDKLAGDEGRIKNRRKSSILADEEEAKKRTPPPKKAYDLSEGAKAKQKTYKSATESYLAKKPRNRGSKSDSDPKSDSDSGQHKMGKASRSKSRSGMGPGKGRGYMGDTVSFTLRMGNKPHEIYSTRLYKQRLNAGL